MVKQQCIMVIWSSASTCNGDTTLAITAINNLFSDIKGFHKEKLVIQGKIWKQSELEMFLLKKKFLVQMLWILLRKNAIMPAAKEQKMEFL